MAKRKGQAHRNRNGKKKLVGAIVLSASVIGATIALPEKVEAQSAPVQVADSGQTNQGIPYLGQGNRNADDHRNEHEIQGY